jgi:hypothetical protein
MPDTIALSPALGVEVVGVDRVLDDAMIGRCLEALKWRGVLLIRGLHLDDDAQLAIRRKLGTVLAPGGREIFTVASIRRRTLRPNTSRARSTGTSTTRRTRCPPRPRC